MIDDANDDLGDATAPDGYYADVESAGDLIVTGAISGDTLASVVDSMSMVVCNAEESDDRERAWGVIDLMCREILDRSRVAHG